MSYRIMEEKLRGVLPYLRHMKEIEELFEKRKWRGS